MTVLTAQERRILEDACVKGHRESEQAVRAALTSLAVPAERPPGHLDEDDRQLRRGLRAKARQLGDVGENFDRLVAECAYEQWHRLLFARFLAENNLLIHPDYRAPVTLEECEELAESLEEPDGWSVAARFAAEILPGIFRLDDPCFRLRLPPEGRLALEAVIANLPSAVFVGDDSLGWVYQFWQMDKKDEVNASERKIGGVDVGPVTQLFTENYMVRFLLENSLGAWWAARHPDSPLIKGFEYLRFDDGRHPSAGTFDGWPERVADVTVMDPCCGSGHFLVEVFSMLWRMRVEEEGLAPVDAQDAVLRDNLFGLELDPRCVQIAMFAIALQAWKAGGGWRQLPVPNIACSGIPVKTAGEAWRVLAGGDFRLEQALERLHILFRDADTLGSLIDPRRVAEQNDPRGDQSSLEDVDWAEIGPLLHEATNWEGSDPALDVLGAAAVGLARAANYLGSRHNLVVTNVPYLLRRRQSPTMTRFADAYYPRGRADLATIFLERLLGMANDGSTVAVVLPNGWTSAASYEALRRHLLSSVRWGLMARLGTGAFGTISGEVVNVCLWIADQAPPGISEEMTFIDASGETGPLGKRDALLRSVGTRPRQLDFLLVGAARISPSPMPGHRLLSEYCHAYKGMTTGDDPRWKRLFWELPEEGRWERMQTASSAGGHYSGCHHLVDFSRMTNPLHPGVELRGEATWGRRGVAVSQMSLSASLSVGAKFDQNVAILLPRSSEDLAPLFSFCSSTEYVTRVREIDQGIKVTNATLTQVPFDVDRWRGIAAEAGPLPEPSSDDPTQWLFDGRPEVSTAPLQVATARLVGYCWPDQPSSGDLDTLADLDGIVCLPPVASEPEAAERLQKVLSSAFGATWSPAKEKELLESTGSKKQSLRDWLRDDFFKQHCALFGHRPFVWHIWDGRRDGFAALVNYHRLDRKTLEKLTYTYLGDWIERQRAARDEIAGAEARLAAASGLRKSLELILEGEPPYDIFVRWKTVAAQPIGWDPDLNDGVRVNVRPFVEAGVLRSAFNVHWRKDRGKNPDGSERLNDVHLPTAEKRAARGETA